VVAWKTSKKIASHEVVNFTENVKLEDMKYSFPAFNLERFTKCQQMSALSPPPIPYFYVYNQQLIFCSRYCISAQEKLFDQRTDTGSW